MNNVDGGGAPPTAAGASLFTDTHGSQVLLAADPLEVAKLTAAREDLTAVQTA